MRASERADAFKFNKGSNAKPDQQQTISSLIRHRRRRSYDVPSEPQQASPAPWQGHKYQRRAVALLAALLLVLATSSWSHQQRIWSPAPRPSTAGSYLRQIAALHDWKQVSAQVDQLQLQLQTTLGACAQQLITPEVKVPQFIPGLQWQPPAAADRPATAVLDLNCSDPDHHTACAAATASNLYEGDTMQLSPEEVMELLQVPVQQHTFTPLAAADNPLAALNLECDTQPQACALAADTSNTYEAAGPIDSSAISSAQADAVAEAAAFLTGSNAAAAYAAAWHVVIGGQPLQEPTHAMQESVLDAANRYEGVQLRSWQHRREAEEAGAHLCDLSLLELDCSAAGIAGDTQVQQECMRSTATNKYESEPGTRPTVNVVLEEPNTAVAAGAVGEGSKPGSQENTRQHFKNPCNSPATHSMYKNHLRTPHERRRHYKNPANAPAALDVVLPLPHEMHKAAAAPSGIQPQTLQSTRVWVALAVLLCSCWYLEELSALSSSVLRVVCAVGRWCGKKLSRPAKKVRRTRSMLLVPCTSQELPAPQLMHVEVPLRAPLPMLGALANTCAPTPSQHQGAAFMLQPAVSEDFAAPHTFLPGAHPHGAPQLGHAGGPASAAASAALFTDSAAIAAGTTVFGSLGMPHEQQGGLSAAQQHALAAAGLAHPSALSLSPGLLLQGPDDVQQGADSPRAASRAPTDRHTLAPRSRAGTPCGPGLKIE